MQFERNSPLTQFGKNNWREGVDRTLSNSTLPWQTGRSLERETRGSNSLPNHDKMMHYMIQVSDNNKTSVEGRLNIAQGAR